MPESRFWPLGVVFCLICIFLIVWPLGVVFCLICIFLIVAAIKYFIRKKPKDSVEIFRLPNNNFHMIINGRQYRLVEHDNFILSMTYNFPSGIKAEGSRSNYFMDKYQYEVIKFKESEEVDKRRKLYEEEMFADLSDSFSKWDKEFSTKELK